MPRNGLNESTSLRIPTVNVPAPPSPPLSVSAAVADVVPRPAPVRAIAAVRAAATIAGVRFRA
jgi:hypothetical protein